MTVLYTVMGNPAGGGVSGESPCGKGVGEVRPSKYGEANPMRRGPTCYMNDFGY